MMDRPHRNIPVTESGKFKKIYRILAEAVLPGRAVILNCIDRPETKLIAIVTEVNNDETLAIPLASYYEARGWESKATNKKMYRATTRSVTPVGAFGLDVFTDEVRYWVARNFWEPTATYTDGSPRCWQETKEAPILISPRGLAASQLAKDTYQVLIRDMHHTEEDAL